MNPRGGVHCFTSATLGHLDRARVLAECLRRHHPDWTLWLCLVDREPPNFRLVESAEPFDYVLRAEELDIPNLGRWLFGHDIVEACTAIKGRVLLHLLETGAQKVFYLDPDIAVFAPLDPALLMLEEGDLVLTPHLLEPQNQTFQYEVDALKRGIYNLGFLGVSGTTEGLRFARWWWTRLKTHCVDYIPGGLFTDQRWCDHVPVFFPSAQVLRDPGFNVASWNVAQRPVSIGRDGIIRAAGVPLRFFHFTKFMTVGGRQRERAAVDPTALREIITWYERTVSSKAPVGLPGGWWAYGHYTDGVPIPLAHRRRWRSDASLRNRILDPFALTSIQFLQSAGL